MPFYPSHTCIKLSNEFAILSAFNELQTDWKDFQPRALPLENSSHTARKKFMVASKVCILSLEDTEWVYGLTFSSYRVT